MLKENVDAGRSAILQVAFKYQVGKESFKPFTYKAVLDGLNSAEVDGLCDFYRQVVPQKLSGCPWIPIETLEKNVMWVVNLLIHEIFI